MQRLAIAGILVVILPSLGFAHVSVRPRESKAGAEERYVVRVPTEGTVATDYVRLEIPEGRQHIGSARRRGSDVRDDEGGRSGDSDHVEQSDSTKGCRRVRVSRPQPRLWRHRLEGASAFCGWYDG